MARWLQGLAGVALLIVGFAGGGALMGTAAVATPDRSGLGPAAASSPDEFHAAMHAMMEGVHGPEAMARMHEVEGVEEMMAACATMMAMMGPMADRMGGMMGPGGTMGPGMGGMRDRGSMMGPGMGGMMGELRPGSDRP